MNTKILTGVLLDDRVELTLTEFCEACSQPGDWVIELVEEGVLEPVGGDREHWRFSGTSLVRATTAVRLQHDLGVNVSGAALAIELMEEIQALRERLRRLEQDDRD